MGGGAGAGDGGDGKAAWLVNLQKKVALYIDALPGNLPLLKRGGDALQNPVFRFFDRECQVLSVLLQTVRKDFHQVYDVCIGERKSTNKIK